MLIPFGSEDWASAAYNIARSKLRNLYMTQNPVSADGVSRITRPSLSNSISVGTGPIAGMWKQSGALDDAIFIVSGTEFFKWDEVNAPTKIGDMPGTGLVEFASISDRLIIVREGLVYSTDGSTLTAVTIPDDAPISSVASINSYFILTVAGSDRFYWINPGGTDPDPLDFATAERFSDFLVCVRTISDEVWFLGSQGVEVWAPTGNGDIPFERIPARVYNEGCASSFSATPITFRGAPALIWVTNKKSVVLAQGSVQPISTESVEEVLNSGATNFRSWYFERQRKDFYVVTSDDVTFVYDTETNTWPRWDSYQYDYWTAHVGCQSGKNVYAGDSETNKVWSLGNAGSDEDRQIVREISGFIPNITAPFPCNFVGLQVNAGWSSVYGFEPQIELRWSDDYGFTWSDYYRSNLGDKGQYDSEIMFRSLGLVKRPGRIFEIRFSEDATFRLDHAIMNEYPDVKTSSS